MAKAVDMQQWRKKHRDSLDTQLLNVEKRLGPTFEQGILTKKQEISAAFDRFQDTVHNIRTSGHYSPEGEQSHITAAARTFQDKLTAMRASTVEKLDAQLAEKRAAALKKKPITDPAQALVRELRLRELRDHLRQLPKPILEGRIKQAVADGANTELLDALEEAPAGFPIGDAALIQETRAAIAERDHPELGELAQLRNTYTYLLGVAEKTLTAATGADAIEIGAAATPPVDTRKPFLVSTGDEVPTR
jgi:hypothetical protein